MRRPSEVAIDEAAMNTLVGITNIFEGLASIRIAQIKNQVLQSEQFFEALWNMYLQLRVDNLFHMGRSEFNTKVVDKELLIIVTGEGGLSGDIDEKLINLLIQNYSPKKQDIIVIGHHGAVQLVHAKVRFKKYYKLPAKDLDINVSPLIREVQKYRNTTVYYQTYVSLMIQDVKRIELAKAVQEQGSKVEVTDETISEQTYIFEPSTFAVVDHLERSMLQVALSQVILESKLAQYASRFRAMTDAHQLAGETRSDLRQELAKSKRMAKDEQLKEILSGLRSAYAL